MPPMLSLVEMRSHFFFRYFFRGVAASLGSRAGMHTTQLRVSENIRSEALAGVEGV